MALDAPFLGRVAPAVVHLGAERSPRLFFCLGVGAMNQQQAVEVLEHLARIRESVDFVCSACLSLVVVLGMIAGWSLFCRLISLGLGANWFTR